LGIAGIEKNTILASPSFISLNIYFSILKRLILLLAFFPLLLNAQREKVKNDPTHDDKWLHFGFSLGINTMDFKVESSQWGLDSGVYAEVAMLRPGFHVYALSNLRLTNSLDFRFTPGISFGGVREITYREFGHSNQLISDSDNPVKVESNFLEFPMTFKYKSNRLNNFRPFIISGFNTRLDLAATKKTWGRSKKENNLVLLKPLDFYYEIGVGTDFYLQYFKFAIELKYSVGLTNVLRTKIEKKGETIYPPPEDAIFTNSIDRLMSRMFMITLHFE
jgi:hypothetical protein